MSLSLINDAKDVLLESMQLVQSKCGSEEYSIYKRAVGRVIVTMLTDLVEPIYEGVPSLKPQGWDEP